MYSFILSVGTSTHTERQIKVCTWLREISSWSCLTVLSGPVWILLSKTCKPLFAPLYSLSSSCSYPAPHRSVIHFTVTCLAYIDMIHQRAAALRGRRRGILFAISHGKYMDTLPCHAMPSPIPRPPVLLPLLLSFFPLPLPASSISIRMRRCDQRDDVDVRQKVVSSQRAEAEKSVIECLAQSRERKRERERERGGGGVAEDEDEVRRSRSRRL